MKIKEAARCCGLTEKAIRLYESKGLIRPATAENNGRTFREYDQKCIRDLMTVGILRRAEFSLEQIGAMQSDCGKIPEILEENLHKLDMNVEHMTAVQAALVGCEGRARNIDELADAIFAALGGAASTDCDAPVQIRWRVWDEDCRAKAGGVPAVHRKAAQKGTGRGYTHGGTAADRFVAWVCLEQAQRRYCQ